MIRFDQLLVPGRLGPVQGMFQSRIVGVYGKNGAGKSTLLRMLSRQDEFQDLGSGQIYVGDIEITFQQDPAQRARCIQYLDSQFGSFVPMTVESIFQIHLEERHATYDREWIWSLFDLGPFLKKKVTELSEGEKQWVGLAWSLFQGSKVFLWDEACSKIDLGRWVRLIRILQSAELKGHQFLIADHDLMMLTKISEEMVIMDQGRFLHVGLTKNVINPETLSTIYPEVRFDWSSEISPVV